jgi:hypothetical protein
MSFNNYKPVKINRTRGGDREVDTGFPGIELHYLGIKAPTTLSLRGDNHRCCVLGCSDKSATGAIYDAIGRMKAAGMEPSRWSQFRKAIDGVRIKGPYREKLPDRGRVHTCVLYFDPRLVKLEADILTALDGAYYKEACNLLRQVDKRLRFEVMTSNGREMMCKILDTGNADRGHVRLRVEQ